MSGTTDKNYLSFVNEIGLSVTPTKFPIACDTAQFDDILKFSSCEKTDVMGFEFQGGREDCIDAVRGTNYLLRNLKLTPRKNGITLKGSIQGFDIQDTVIAPTGRSEIELGQFDNYWKPGRAPTRGGFILRCSTGTPKPVRLVCWDADVPHIEDSNVEVRRIPKCVWFPYFVTQYFWVRLKGLKTT